MRTYDIITFDCYGTLIDWNAGIVRAFQEAAAADGVKLGSEDILQAYHDAEPVVERESYLPYREVLSQVAQQCAAPCAGGEAARRLQSDSPSSQGQFVRIYKVRSSV